MYKVRLRILEKVENFGMKRKFHFRGGVFPDTALLTKL